MKNVDEMEGILRIDAPQEGPVSIVLAGVHGNETCGVEVLRNLLSSLTLKRGSLLYGFGNPRAIAANKRFIEANLNRMFKDDNQLTPDERQSYEYARAQFLKPYLEQADALLDIHASTTPDSRPFIICEDNARNIAEAFPIDLRVSGFDAIEPGGTDYYMNRIGKIGICVECGYLNDPASVTVAEESLWRFLIARGHIDGQTEKQRQQKQRVYMAYITQTDNFIPAQAFRDFDPVVKGQTLATDGDKAITAPDDGVILFAGPAKQKGVEGFLLAKKEPSD